MNELDRNKAYSPVQGDSRAAYYQGGRYFASDGLALSAADASQPGENGSFANQVESQVQQEVAKENAKKPLTLVDDQNPRTNSPDDIKAAKKRAANRKNGVVKTVEVKKVEIKTVTAGDIDARKAKRAELNKLHISQLRELVAKAGQVPITGRGSKASNIKLLLDSTE